jgi:bifunctional oligoribonuclease and PAP phosphatase NrnA
MFDLINREKIDVLQAKIAAAENIVVCSHKHPDGDAVGCLLSFANFLSDKTKAKYILPNQLPDYLAWLNKSSDIIIAENDIAYAAKCIKEADLLIAVDFNDPMRLASLAESFTASEAFKIAIDHHPMGDYRYDLVFNDLDVSSASEIVYILLSQLNHRKINRYVAEAVYAGIVTDTGSLSYSCNNPSTYNVMAEIMKFGLDGAAIHNLLYNNFPLKRTRLLGYILDKKLVVRDDLSISYYVLTHKELEEFDYEEGMLSNVINYALNIRGVQMAASFVEHEEGVIRMSFRSRGDVCVNTMSSKYFNGGGHKNASGATSMQDVDTLVNLYISVANEYIL